MLNDIEKNRLSEIASDSRRLAEEYTCILREDAKRSLAAKKAADGVALIEQIRTATYVVMHWKDDTESFRASDLIMNNLEKLKGLLMKF